MPKLPRFKPKKPLRFSRHPEPGYVVGGKIWLEKDGELYIGGGRSMLLERIDKFGSIAAAARSMRLGYRNAWLWIEAVNRLAPAPLVEKTTGGTGGGHARLTEEGRKVIHQYKELRDRFAEFLKQVG
ncbi:MAG TPA: LysR family transcriptional regulator [Desulfobacteraceae bacterium]|nr:LysR family transcriptional regulator [Desulfobacteraceae bacterium]HPJ68927.1 LysR family transcriptional regulator [Desulfobacteraceae bacterium]HPQ27901.1 LysR family transcriptional regulator [Desulfobacteraceae bacterium]